MKSAGSYSHPSRWADRGVGAFGIAIGSFLLLAGTMMLVVPHQFTSPSYSALLPHLGTLGVAFVCSGAALLSVSMTSVPGNVRVLAHLAGGGGMLALSWGIGLAGGWTGMINFGVMGIGTALAPFVASSSRERSQYVATNWLATMAGLGSVLTGLSILLMPWQFGSPIYDIARHLLPYLGAAFLCGGLFLVAANLLLDIPRAAFWAAHLLAGMTLLAFVFVSSFPLRAWLGIAYYGGIGTFIMLLPWVDSRLRRVDIASLRARLALALGVAAALPLLFTASYALDRQEDATSALALRHQQELASSVAQDVTNYLALHWSAVAALAGQPGLLDASVDAQQQNLRAVASAYSDVSLFATTDLFGRMVARSDRQAAGIEDVVEVPPPLEGSVRPAFHIRVSSSTGRLNLEIISPVVDQGRAKGFIVGMLDLRRVADMLARARSSDSVTTYLVDEQGTVITNQDMPPLASASDFSSREPVKTFLERRQTSGSLLFGSTGNEKVAGYARVQGLGWGVVLEEPLSLILAESRAQREIAFIVLVVGTMAAAVLGYWLAGYLVMPLQVLVHSVGDIASGRRGVRLPDSSISELRRLSEAVGEMTEELVSAEAETDRWLVAEQDARAQAEAAVRAREEFISVAAHELKTPVTSLRGYAQLIMYQFGKMGKLDPERVAKAMEQVEQQTTRLTRLTDQLLNLSRLESGKLMLCPEETDVSSLVQSIVANVQHSHPKRSFEVCEGGPVRAMVDPLRIEQVVTNLLDNAVKFSPGDTPIEVRVWPEGGDWVRISVRDHGFGIPEEKKDHVFERFYQAHAERHYGGMGIGLYISRQIAELHGGAIDLEEPEDGGTRFIIRLPIAGRNPGTLVEAVEDGGEHPSHPGSG